MNRQSIFEGNGTLFDESTEVSINKRLPAEERADTNEEEEEAFYDPSNLPEDNLNDDPIDLHELLESTKSQLVLIWDNIGYGDEKQCQLFQELVEGASDIYKKSLINAYALKEDMNREVDVQLQIIGDICDSLGDEDPKDYLLTDSHQTLREHVAFLKGLMEEFEGKRDQRQALVQKEMEYLEALCGMLDERFPDAIQLKYERGVILMDFVREIQSSIESLKRLKGERTEIVSGLLHDIYCLSIDLDFANSKDLIEWKESGDISSFGITKDSIATLGNKLELLQREEVSRMDKINKTFGCIEHLWDRLGIEESYKQEFYNTFSERTESSGTFVEKVKPSFETLNQLAGELDKMTILKKENLIVLVENIRNQIRTVWDNLRFGMDQKKSLLPLFNISVLNDKVLDDHEAELSRLSGHLESLQDVFAMIDKRAQYIEEIAEVKLLSQDPDRFKRRDSFKILKREERCSQLEKKVLPKLEGKLKNAILEWEADNGPLLINDKRFLDTLEIQVSLQAKEKDLERAIKSREKQLRRAPSVKSSRASSRSRTSSRPRKDDEKSIWSSGDPSIGMLLKHAGIAEKSGNLGKAVECFSQAIELCIDKEQLCKLYYQRAQIYQQMNNFEKALEDSAKAMNINGG